MTKKTTEKKPSAKNANGTIPPQGDETNTSPLTVNAQYIKDLSFENPSAISHIMGGQEAPEISIHIEAQAHNLVDRTFEVVLRIQVEASRKEGKVFILELEYAGLFTIGGDVPEEYIRPILMVECPRILFPFARNIVASITQDAGYPSLLLTPVDFADLYQRQLAEEHAALAEKQKEKPTIQ